ncbi:hypothetical protein K7X08_005513 [Anisodus acutangulus]|uniref:Uncharacterized protein n=1 Tax=Anisodus acutangulus TaxID=402998 RepID=A0A9Q1R890_9SOLA|nr:hypothetical protein K7X08_005513 [Anisodus acutangulus]
MFASPLFIINLVIRTRSVEFMPFYMSLPTFLMSASFFLYGIFIFDPFIYVPNGIGTLLGVCPIRERTPRRKGESKCLLDRSGE